jgi:hypothetical protein
VPRTKVNATCNVLTGEDRKRNHRNDTPEITLPSLRLNVSPAEARRIAGDLLQAAEHADPQAVEVLLPDPPPSGLPPASEGDAYRIPGHRGRLWLHVPQMPPDDAICHRGLCTQAECAHCQRIAQVRAALLEPARVWIAELHSPSFTFTATGADRDAAIEALEIGLCAHAKAVGVERFWEPDDFSVYPVPFGSCVRDREYPLTKRDAELAKRIELAKRQVIADVHAGHVPADVESFSRLHDHRDANYYGDAFEPDAPSCTAAAEFWNNLQDAIDRWIKGGGLRKAIRKASHA